MLELYHWEPNGSYLKPLIALNEKGLAFHSRYIDVLSFEQYRPGFLHASRETRLNLEGEGPVLFHDGRQVTESLFLCEYLEDAFPETPSLRSAVPIEHARILAWGRFINEVLMPAVNTLGCHTWLAPHFVGRNLALLEPLLAQIPMDYLRDGWRRVLENRFSEELLADSQRKVELGVRRIDEALAAGQWLIGSAYSLADIDAFAVCNSLPTLMPALVNDSVTPRLMDWLRRIRVRPAVRAALAVSRTGKPEQAFAPGPEHSRWG